MIILAIETSCDDTSIALIQTREKERVSFNILSNIVSSQIEIHKKWGGVYPTLARREHQRNLIPVLEKVLKESKKFRITDRRIKISGPQLKTLKSIFKKEPELLNGFLDFIPKIKKPEIEVIALTVGPGLEPCLWTGINFARALSYLWQVPIIQVNHIEAHIYANFIDEPKILFPAVCLVVSGGHTQLILMKNHGQYKVLGETQDDAAGECLDKVARILGLEYPGGPVIESESKKFTICNPDFKIKLPRPMIHSKDYNFSFSGLKTAVLYDFKERSPKIRKDKNYIRQICAETQQSVIDVLIYKTIKAVKNYGIKSIILGGGVTANKELRKQFVKKTGKEFPDLKLYIPNSEFCTDNGVMVAVVSFFHRKDKKNWKKIKAQADLRIN